MNFNFEGKVVLITGGAEKAGKVFALAFAKAGADLINIHAEAEGCIGEMIDKIHALGKKAAVTIKPNTPENVLFPYLDMLDMVLVMSVEPGFGGQAFMPSSLDKVRSLKAEITRLGSHCLIEIDGGINLSNAHDVIAAGADILVAGSAVFGATDVQAAVKAFKTI